MSLTLFASIFVLLINQSFACDCGQATSYVFPEGTLSRFPWYVVIENQNKSCGASLIDDQHVAIAAHCLSGSNATSLGVHLNDNSTKSISSIWVDERYNETNGAYDFAVLTLDSPVDSQFKPICLEESDKWLIPSIYLISPTSDGNEENYLYSYPSYMKCPSPATETHFCVMNPTKLVECPEGPYMRREFNNRHYLTGVTSRCFSSGMPDLFTDARFYEEKIRELAPKSCWKNKYDSRKY